MISGFNTDVKVGDLVYHVQSEARQSELLFQTQVFLSGRIVGKRTRSYANLTIDAAVPESAVQEKLKELHREVVHAAREGHIEEFLASDRVIQDVDGQGLCLHWLNPEIAHEALPSQPVLRIAVTDWEFPQEGAMLTCRLEASSSAPISARAESGSDGTAELRLRPDPQWTGGGEKFVIVHAEYKSKSATRKFRLRRG